MKCGPGEERENMTARALLTSFDAFIQPIRSINPKHHKDNSFLLNSDKYVMFSPTSMAPRT